MRLSPSLLQDPGLVFQGQSDVQVRAPMGMHELQTVNLKLGPAKTMRRLSNAGKPKNPLLQRLAQTVLTVT